MSFRLIKSWIGLSTETDKFFDKKILNVSHNVNDKTIHDFKILLAKHPQARIDRAFAERFRVVENEALTRCLIFFFMYMNLNSIKDIKSFFVFLSDKNFFRLKEDRKVFKNDRQIIRRVAPVLLQQSVRQILVRLLGRHRDHLLSQERPDRGESVRAGHNRRSDRV